MTERAVRDFHDAHPGITSRAFARSGSYERLAAVAAHAGTRVLDLGCGDGHLLRILVALGCHSVGIDLSTGELSAVREIGDGPLFDRAALGCHAIRVDLSAGKGSGTNCTSSGHDPDSRPPCGRVSCNLCNLCLTPVQGRAQELPFADRSFDAVLAHLSFMLFADLPMVVAELARVLVPGGRFAAMLGGGPVAAPEDAFHEFLAIARFAPPAVGRSITEAEFRALFAGWRAVTWERLEVDLSGSFADVWAFLGASYQLVDADATRDPLAARYADVETVPCRVVLWLATATR